MICFCVYSAPAGSAEKDNNFNIDLNYLLLAENKLPIVETHYSKPHRILLGGYSSCNFIHFIMHRGQSLKCIKVLRQCVFCAFMTAKYNELANYPVFNDGIRYDGVTC